MLRSHSSRFLNTGIIVLSSVIVFATAACAPKKSAPPLVTSVQTEVLREDRPSASPESKTSQEIKVTATVDRALLLSQEFLYGADLQYSSLYDKDMDLYTQSLAIGHVPARFFIVGDELQLIADQSRRYPSAVNHPSQILSRFKIHSRDEKSLTISGADSRGVLAQLFAGASADTPSPSIINAKAKPPRDLWIRSFEFAPKGNYLLQQTSVILDDGTVAELMESIFPRENLAPGKDFQMFELDPENAAGADEGPAARYRFLGGEHVFQGEKKHTLAQHFDHSRTDLNPEGTIDWYATRNISDDEIKPVALAVEAWNRYFRKLKGIERDVVRFKGRLPEGIHLGDPRFNVINWDNRLVAGAAYETQAVDPLTGKQSHSLIYMPAAWFKIGVDYWKKGRYSEPKSESVSPAALARLGGIASSARLRCARELEAASALLASGRLEMLAEGSAKPATSVLSDVIRDFGIRLLKGTLFHEVGHALGMAHNFKGSLSFNRKDPKSAFSTSIMDYNDFEIELAAFAGVDSAEGPALEYDRQVMSALYNRSVDVAEKDPELPACNDEEADEEEDGVDPLCIRYDAEHDPTLSISTALERLELAARPGDVTLAQSIARVPGVVLTADALAAAKSEKALAALVADLGANLRGSIHFYLYAGKASIARVVRLNAKSLLVFGDDVLEDAEGVENGERGLRERAYRGIQKALALKTLSAPAAAAAERAVTESLAQLAKSPYWESLSAELRSSLSDKVAKSLRKAIQSVETDAANGFPKVRATVIASLIRHKKVPFYFGKPEGSEQGYDFEASIVGVLGDLVTASGEYGASASKSERLTAAAALATFAGRPQGEPAIRSVLAALERARVSAADNASRELVEALIQSLKPSPKGEPGSEDEGEES